MGLPSQLGLVQAGYKNYHATLHLSLDSGLGKEMSPEQILNFLRVLCDILIPVWALQNGTNYRNHLIRNCRLDLLV
jgi:hypothetical protein